MKDADVLEDYNELMVCFGFLILFFAVLPLTPLLALTAIFCEVKVDAFKYSALVQLSYPLAASDIYIYLLLQSLKQRIKNIVHLCESTTKIKMPNIIIECKFL